MDKANENASKSSRQAKEDEIATEAGVILKLQSLQPESEESVLTPTKQLPSSVQKPLEDQ
ncbi:flagellin [Bacillus cereus]|nr:flagellin [Bacillus cereus]